MLLVRNHPDKSALIKDLQQIDTCNLFREKSKKVIHNLGERGVLRDVRNFFLDPVFLCFEILGRKHRLLHLWDLFDTCRAHQTIDQRETTPILFFSRITPWCSLRENRCAARVSPIFERVHTKTTGSLP